MRTSNPIDRIINFCNKVEPFITMLRALTAGERASMLVIVLPLYMMQALMMMI